MKEQQMTGCYFAAAGVAAAGLIFGLWLVGGETLRTVLLLLAGAVALALIIGAAALPIRAWRRNDAQPVVKEHYYHDGQTKVIERHTIDGRTVEGPKLYQLPAAPNGAAFPELLRAAWQAGQLTARRADETVDGEGHALTPDDWGGPLE